MTASSDTQLHLSGLPEDLIGTMALTPTLLTPPFLPSSTPSGAALTPYCAPLRRASFLCVARILQCVDSATMLLTINRLSSAFKQHTDEPQSVRQQPLPLYRAHRSPSSQQSGAARKHSHHRRPVSVFAQLLECRVDVVHGKPVNHSSTHSHCSALLRIIQHVSLSH